MCPDIQRYVLTNHALLEMTRRGITAEEIESVLANPAQRTGQRKGRCVYQSKQYSQEAKKDYLLRVFVDIDQKPAQVVTVYRTSKVQKYWR